jgi:protein-disulfide isomerase
METLMANRHLWATLWTFLGPRLLLGCLALTGLSGCSQQKSAAAQSQSQSLNASPGDGIPAVLASIGDEQITLADIRARVGDDLDQMESRYRQAHHKLIETTLQEILRDRVLLAEARKQGKTVDQLIAAEAGGTLEPTEVEIAAWYQDNRSRTGGRSLEQIRPQIADYLRSERRKQVTQTLTQRLNQERKVTVNLEPYRVPFNNERAPAVGPANAPVTLVEFSDFQCPFCERFFPTLKQLQQHFGDKLRVVYRQFPLTNIHPNAFKAAEASLCADDQGQFWDMHDLLFQEQDRLAVRDLKVKASRLGLNQKKFDACLDSGRHVEQVQEDLKEGTRIGVTGTPAIFINGIPLEGGAVPYEVVAAAIEKEMERGQPGAPAKQSGVSTLRCTTGSGPGRQCVVANVTP